MAIGYSITSNHTKPGRGKWLRETKMDGHIMGEGMASARELYVCQKKPSEKVLLIDNCNMERMVL